MFKKLKEKIKQIRKKRVIRKREAKACPFWVVCEYFTENKTCLNEDYRIIHLDEVRCGQFSKYNKLLRTNQDKFKKEIKIKRSLNFILIDSKFYQ